MHQVQHRQQLERLVFGGIVPRRAGGAVEGGELFYGGGESVHGELKNAPF